MRLESLIREFILGQAFLMRLLVDRVEASRDRKRLQ